MGSKAAENSQEDINISEQQAPTLPSHHSSKKAQISQKRSLAASAAELQPFQEVIYVPQPMATL